MKKPLQENGFAKAFAVLACIFLVLAALLYWVGSEQMEAVEKTTSAVTPSASDGGLVGTNALEQKFRPETDTLDQFRLFIGTYGRVNESDFALEILDGDACLWRQEYAAQDMQDWTYNVFVLDTPLENVKNRELTLRILTEDVPAGQAVTFYYGSAVSTGKFEVAVNPEYPLTINGQPVEGVLCLSLTGRDLLPVKALYWPAVMVLLVCLGLGYHISCRRFLRDGRGLVGKALGLKRYTFLMKQLIARDFKTKYKRSVLGVLWSFLNPLLTMSVQYVVFSSLFQSNIESFAVYLMTGGIVFNFFSEAVGLGLTSIVSNASLITKVYVPKYIYPTARVLSSAVNFLISMIPLCLMILLSGIPIGKSILLLPVLLVFVTVFCIGMSLILSSLMVFFRDIQFLWGIVSMLWMYMTPIFYPESIIPQSFIGLYRMNPLYQFIYFLREITINGNAPSPYTYLYCALAAVIPLTIGLVVFKKTQDRFVLYL